MKTFYVWQDPSWMDRRKGEAGIRLIRAGYQLSTDVIQRHVAKRLMKFRSRLYNLDTKE